ncbi:hypothetical protein HRQ91_00665 [Treponema parvum]|uniref:Uncharacterized protein n=1 Tax=Treponema parvum TaxID=138851 RepID=A0A975F245_9SPIR|nr:hypothetical protein [Treponema parvum]QTQ13084.1 hypothetical protein HRQ91_00665 [Treponema parvum]
MSDSELDPSILALLNQATQSTAQEGNGGEGAPENDAFTDEQGPLEAAEGSTSDPIKVDLSKKEFAPIEKFFQDVPADFFDDPSYYKTALSGEDQSAQRLHSVLSKYLKCRDAQDRTVFRQRLVSAYWEFFRSIAPKMRLLSTPMPKRLLLRYGVLLPSLFTPEQKQMFAKAFIENTSDEPVFYVDEWFKEIASGRLPISATDEARPAHKASSPAEVDTAEQQYLLQLQTKNNGKLQNSESLLSVKENERSMLESELRNRIDMLLEHQPAIGLEPHKMPYSDLQKKLFSEINERLRALSRNDKELSANFKDFREAKEIQTSLQEKIAAGPQLVEVRKSDIDTEMTTVRQMVKMTVGRQGNQFPIFSREFFHCLPKETGFRENVISILSWIESIDPGAFCRIHKNVPNRIVPFVLLVPSYGEFGFCWEPFDRYNRITSRGRIVIPMYPRNLQISILRAVADLRWQVAKEKASYYWMEEGLTGQYYQWIDSQKLKGDLKSFFIEDYILWMTKESTGVQRLEKTVRGIFWRHLPFPQSLKDELKKRSLAYAELYQKDINRAMSDGY